MSRDDRGSSVVEFVLMTMLLSTLLFALLQVGFYFYARNVVAASAADGARYAAAAGMPSESGTARALQLTRAALFHAGDSLTCRSVTDEDAGSGLPTVTVRCTGTLHAVYLPAAGWLRIDVRSSALRERVR